MKSGSVLPEQFMNAIDQQLGRFYERTGVTIVLFVDESGQLISYIGDADNVNLPGLAALMASDMAAVTEMARRISEKDGFQLLIHEGEIFSILTSAVNKNFFLVSIFKNIVPIGLVRLYTKWTVINLRKIVEQLEATSPQAEPIVGVDFTSSLADELERIFGE